MDEFTFKDRDLWKPGRGNLPNTVLCLRGIGRWEPAEQTIEISKWQSHCPGCFLHTSPDISTQSRARVSGTRQVRPVPPLCFYKSQWPSLLSPSPRLALFPISRCSSFFSSCTPRRKGLGTAPSHPLAWHFHFIKQKSMCLCAGRRGGAFRGGPHYCPHWWLK